MIFRCISVVYPLSSHKLVDLLFWSGSHQKNRNPKPKWRFGRIKRYPIVPVVCSERLCCFDEASRHAKICFQVDIPASIGKMGLSEIKQDSRTSRF